MQSTIVPCGFAERVQRITVVLRIRSQIRQTFAASHYRLVITLTQQDGCGFSGQLPYLFLKWNKPTAASGSLSPCVRSKNVPFWTSEITLYTTYAVCAPQKRCRYETLDSNSKLTLDSNSIFTDVWSRLVCRPYTWAVTAAPQPQGTVSNTLWT